MGEVVSIEVAARRRDANMQEAWDRFVAAMQKSKETLDMRDGIVAGKAYREFLDLCAKGGRQ